MALYNPVSPVPKQQTAIAFSQAGPVSGTLYPILVLTGLARIIGVECEVIWTVQPTPLEVVMVIDGETITWTVTNPVSTTKYYAEFAPLYATTAQPLITSDHAGYRSFLVEAQSITIGVRTTGGTVQTLNCRVLYAKW